MSTRLSAAVAALLVTSMAYGQEFPTKPIRIIPGQPGGGGWLQIQLMRDLLTQRLGQPVVLDSRAATIMGGILARAEPNGYTLLSAGGTVWFAPLLAKTDYDTLRDFAPISGIGVAPYFLVVNPALPVNSVKELIALAKSQPGKLNYSSGGLGSGYYISGETFKSMAGVNIVSVPYQGASPSVQAVVSGEVQLTFAPVETVLQLIKAGKLKALAQTLRKPTPLAPDLPSVSDAGVPGFEYQAFNALFAPARTPESVISRLNKEVVWVLYQKDIQEKFLRVGIEAAPSTPGELATAVKTKYAAVSEMIKVHNFGK